MNKRKLVTHQNRPLRIAIIGDPNDVLEAMSLLALSFDRLHSVGTSLAAIDYRDREGEVCHVLRIDMPEDEVKP